MTPVQILSHQAESAAACAAVPLSQVARVAGEQLHAWALEQTNITSAQRRELAGLAILLDVLADRMEQDRAAT